MKKILLLMFALFSMHSFAQNNLNVYQKDGGIVSYAFSNKPIMVITEDTIEVQCFYPYDKYAVKDIKKITFEDIKTAIAQFSANDVPGNVTIVSNINGTVVTKYVENGKDFSFNIESLPTGIYIIKKGSLTYKIVKQ